MEQMFSPGAGPHKTHVVSQPKKQDQNVFYQLDAQMNALPSAELPRRECVDTHFLDASEGARLKNAGLMQKRGFPKQLLP